MNTNFHVNQSPFTTINVSNLAISLWQDRIAESLSEKSTPSSKRFWRGFITGLVDYHIITERDYRWLRDSIEDFTTT